MNQISSRFSLCRATSLLRKNSFTRSSKPISSLISNKSPTSSSNLVFILKLHHHTFNYPPLPTKTPAGNHHFRKFSGEAAEHNFGDDDFLKTEFKKIQDEIIDAECGIEFGRLPPLDGIKVLADKFNPLMEKLGLPTLDDHGKPAGGADDYPHHLQKYGKEIQDLVESVNETVAFAEFWPLGNMLQLVEVVVGNRSWVIIGV
ncbi:hypothetical protein MKW92_010616 [Papaver armeniacum]|nr:hypothetical protein MKW92_010616 [Papaver armeniacum]